MKKQKKVICCHEGRTQSGINHNTSRRQIKVGPLSPWQHFPFGYSHPNFETSLDTFAFKVLSCDVHTDSKQQLCYMFSYPLLEKG